MVNEAFMVNRALPSEECAGASAVMARAATENQSEYFVARSPAALRTARCAARLGRPRLPQRLPRPFRPGTVVLRAADAVFTHVGEDLARRRQAFGIDPLVGIPQVRPHDGPRALKIDFVDGHDDDGARRL